MESEDRNATPDAGAGEIWIRGAQLVLRPLQLDEIDDVWHAIATADPMSIVEVPDEVAFRTRLRQSGRLQDGWLDLGIDLDGLLIGWIQTRVPAHRAVPTGTYTIGMGLHESLRGLGYGREAVALFTDWLFEHAAADAVEASVDPANVAIHKVLSRVGWTDTGPFTELGREWLMYRITRSQWADSNR
jgi:RimJ/RimL family protein N-acetyltransferase